MNWNIALSSAVIAAALAAMANVFVAILNNQHLKAIEKKKRIEDCT